MSNITVAKSSGFCFGVNRAVKMVYDELDKNTKAATLGPIIHNQDVVRDMEQKGARIIDDVEELRSDEAVVIRSHGVSKDIYDKISAKGNRIIDATCPFVARIHNIVAQKNREGYFILIAGDENHPEVQGIVGHCDENCLVFKDNFELKAFFEKKYGNLKKKLAIVAQTTYNIIVWDKCLKEIPENIKSENIVVFNTICNATEKRQSDAKSLAEKSDLMLVVGGKHSSNTIKLAEVCNSFCKTYHIENARELLNLKLPYAENIGITAGASTPAYIIKEVLTTMTEILNNLDDEKEIFNEEMIDQSFKKIHTRDKVTATVETINSNGIFVSLGAKQTGFVALDDLTDDASKKPSDIVSVGDEIELIVTKVNDQDGIVTLSKRKVDEQAGFDKVVKAKEEGTVLEAAVKSVVKGGVVVSYSGVRIFIPSSLTGLPRNSDLEQLLKKKVQFIVIEVGENRRRAVGSMKAVINAQKEEAKEKFWAAAKVGDVFTGKVKSITSFGAFVDLGGIDGMVHISELSWKRIRHPNEVVSVGDTLEVYIKDLNQEENRISLGYRKAEDNPWEILKANYNEGDIVKVTIVSITSFGAFARIVDGIDGLIHISQLADQKVENVKDVLSVGDEVEAKIISIDFENKRVSLSIRALSETNND